MTIISLKAEKPREDGVVEAKFSDGSLFLFSTDYLPEAFNAGLLEEGRELAGSEEEALRFAASCYRAEKAALKLIARAEQNSLGLTFKLERRGHDAPIVKAVVSRLLDRDLLNDERFAELWLRSHLSYGKAQSPQWLLASLGKRGVDRNSSQKALKSLLDPETEYALLLRYLEKAGIDKEKESFLRSRLKNEGFSYDVLERYFDSYTD